MFGTAMFALVIYHYNYLSYATWCLGSIAMAWLLHREFRRMPRFVTAVFAFSLASATAFSMGELRFDLFMAHHMEFYIYYPDWVHESWDNYYTDVKTVLLDLLPLYYAYRFLGTSGRDAVRFAIIPATVVLFAVFEECFSEFTRSVYPSSIAAVALTHSLVAGLFVIRGLRSGASALSLPPSPVASPALGDERAEYPQTNPTSLLTGICTLLVGGILLLMSTSGLASKRPLVWSIFILTVAVALSGRGISKFVLPLRPPHK